MRIMRLGFTAAVMVGHALVVLGAALIASQLRFGSISRSPFQNFLVQPDLSLLAYIALSIWVFRRSGLYRFDKRWTLTSALKDSAKAVAVLAVATLTLLFLVSSRNVSRLYLTGFFALTFMGISLTTVGVRTFYANRRRRGKGGRHVLLVGTSQDVLALIRGLALDHPELGIRIVGYLGPSNDLAGWIPHLGSIESLSQVLREWVVDEVVVATQGEDRSQLDDLVRTAQEQGKTVRVPLPSMGYSISHGEIEVVDQTPFLTIPAYSHRYLALGLKRATDIMGASIGLIVLSPILVATATAIRIKDGSPVFFRQTRVGLNGRHFSLIKFRSMVPNAEGLRHAIIDLNERDGPTFKVRNDPRITPLGRLLRRTSLDELPQLWNVLVGHMSLVGPRPPIPEEVDQYDPWHLRRLAMKPGITGLWQVRQRADPGFDSWVLADLEYIDNWSLTLDSRILVATIPAVFRGSGA